MTKLEINRFKNRFWSNLVSSKFGSIKQAKKQGQNIEQLFKKFLESLKENVISEKINVKIIKKNTIDNKDIREDFEVKVNCSQDFYIQISNFTYSVNGHLIPAGPFAVGYICKDSRGYKFCSNIIITQDNINEIVKIFIDFIDNYEKYLQQLSEKLQKEEIRTEKEKSHNQHINTVLAQKFRNHIITSNSLTILTKDDFIISFYKKSKSKIIQNDSFEEVDKIEMKMSAFSALMNLHTGVETISIEKCSEEEIHDN